MNAEGKIVRSRLIQWGQWIQNPKQVHTRLASPNGRIADDKHANGIHGDGIRYEIIDGVSVPPDGGLAREMECRARAWGWDTRAREVNEAIRKLTPAMEQVVQAVYVVDARSQPRTLREVAAKMNKAHTTIAECLDAAHKRIAREIFGPFEVLPDAANTHATPKATYTSSDLETTRTARYGERTVG